MSVVYYLDVGTRRVRFSTLASLTSAEKQPSWWQFIRPDVAGNHPVLDCARMRTAYNGDETIVAPAAAPNPILCAAAKHPPQERRSPAPWDACTRPPCKASGLRDGHTAETGPSTNRVS